MLWTHLREEQFPQAIEESHKVCAIPIGATEKHGQHLPVGTDTLEVGKIAELAAKIEKVVVFPKVFFGNNQGAQAFPASKTGYGYIALNYDLLFELYRALIEEVARNGFDRILLVSGHGGNSNIFSSLIKSICATKKDYSVFSYMPELVLPAEILKYVEDHGGRANFPQLTDEDFKTMEEYVANNKYDGHGGFGETAWVMGTYPELVDLSRCEAESGLTTHIADPLAEKGIQWGRAWYANYPNAYCGHPPIGLTQQIADLSVKIAVEKLADVYKTLKDDSIMNPIINSGYIDHRKGTE